MTPEQRALVLEMVAGRLAPADLRRCLGADVEAPMAMLQEAFNRRDAEDVACCLLLAFQFEAITSDDGPLLCGLLLAEWHECHEDVARTLEDLRDPRSVVALYEAALTAKAHRYLAYDDGNALARKCTWALAKIDTPAAWEKLEALSRCGGATLESFASKRLVARSR